MLKISGWDELPATQILKHVVNLSLMTGKGDGLLVCSACNARVVQNASDEFFFLPTEIIHANAILIDGKSGQPQNLELQEFVIPAQYIINFEATLREVVYQLPVKRMNILKAEGPLPADRVPFTDLE